jgi:glycerophosphoryl diester phosphodiesterase
VAAWVGGFAWLAAVLLCPATASAFDLQGHRGARGLAPENTLAAFETALRIGVDTLELDVFLTADGHLVVTHDPLVSADLARDATGRWLPGPGPAIRSLSLAEVQTYDVGRARPDSPHARNFLQQQAADGQRIPRLSQVFELAARLGDRSLRFNIEIKYQPNEPLRYAPMEMLVDVLVRDIQAAGLAERSTIQSFYWPVLQRVQQVAPTMSVGHLTAQRPGMNTVDATNWMAGRSLQADGSVPKMVRAAGGRIWSPNFRDLTPELVREAQALGVKVVPWTVNEPGDLQQVLALQVDGVITDYPDRARTVMQARKLPLPAAAVPAASAAATRR